jgi:hypothetical protein
MRLGVHRNLNNISVNATPTDPINKACWACHGDGTQPTGHPVRQLNPWQCVECHNATTNFTSPNSTLQNDTTRKKTYNHIPAEYTITVTAGLGYKITSDFWVAPGEINCITCHNKSKANFTDSITPTDYLAANVSHYANTSNLVTPSKNCTLCHKTPATASDWYANVTRHPAKSQNITFCANCHNTNATNATSLHSEPLFYSYSIHGGMSETYPNLTYDRGFDWENDDYNESGAVPDGEEPCRACHGYASPGDISANIQSVKLCENCHMPNTTSLFTGPNKTGSYNLRSDINDTDRKSTRLNSSHNSESRMPSSA